MELLPFQTSRPNMSEWLLDISGDIENNSKEISLKEFITLKYIKNTIILFFKLNINMSPNWKSYYWLDEKDIMEK